MHNIRFRSLRVAAIIAICTAISLLISYGRFNFEWHINRTEWPVMVLQITAGIFLFKLLFLFKRIHFYRSQIHTLKFVIALLGTVLMTLWFLFSSFASGFLLKGFKNPVLVQTLAYPEQGTVIYIYELSCYPPDSQKECDEHQNFIYYRQEYSPIVRLILKTELEVESLDRNGDLLEIDLETGKVVFDLKEHRLRDGL